MSPITFQSKRDAWIVILVWAVAIAAGFMQISLDIRLVDRVLMLGGIAFASWVVYGTSYTLSDEELFIRCGPLRPPRASSRRRFRDAVPQSAVQPRSVSR